MEEKDSISIWPTSTTLTVPWALTIQVEANPDAVQVTKPIPTSAISKCLSDYNSPKIRVMPGFAMKSCQQKVWKAEIKAEPSLCEEGV